MVYLMSVQLYEMILLMSLQHTCLIVKCKAIWNWRAGERWRIIRWGVTGFN